MYQWLCDFLYPFRFCDDSSLSLSSCSHLLKDSDMCPVPPYGHFVSSIFESEIKRLGRNVKNVAILCTSHFQIEPDFVVSELTLSRSQPTG